MTRKGVRQFEKYRRIARNELAGKGRAKTASGEDKGIVMHLSTSDPNKLIDFFGNNPEEGAGVIDALIESIMEGEMVPNGEMSLPMPGAPAGDNGNGKGNDNGDGNGKDRKKDRNGDKGGNGGNGEDEDDEDNGNGNGDDNGYEEDEEKEASLPVNYRRAKRSMQAYLNAGSSKEANEGDGGLFSRLAGRVGELDPGDIIEYVKEHPEVAAGLMGAVGGGVLGGTTGRGLGGRLGRAGMGAAAGGAAGAGTAHLASLIRNWLEGKKDEPSAPGDQ